MLERLPDDILRYIYNISSEPLRIYVIYLGLNHRLRTLLRGKIHRISFANHKGDLCPLANEIHLEHAPPQGSLAGDRLVDACACLPPGDALAALVGPCRALEQLELPLEGAVGITPDHPPRDYRGWVDEAFANHPGLHTLQIPCLAGLIPQALDRILEHVGGSLRCLEVHTSPTARQARSQPGGRLPQAIATRCPQLVTLRMGINWALSFAAPRLLAEMPHLERWVVPWHSATGYSMVDPPRGSVARWTAVDPYGGSISWPTTAYVSRSGLVLPTYPPYSHVPPLVELRLRCGDADENLVQLLSKQAPCLRTLTLDGLAVRRAGLLADLGQLRDLRRLAVNCAIFEGPPDGPLCLASPTLEQASLQFGCEYPIALCLDCPALVSLHALPPSIGLSFAGPAPPRLAAIAGFDPRPLLGGGGGLASALQRVDSVVCQGIAELDAICTLPTLRAATRMTVRAAPQDGSGAQLRPSHSLAMLGLAIDHATPVSVLFIRAAGLTRLWLHAGFRTGRVELYCPKLLHLEVTDFHEGRAARHHPLQILWRPTVRSVLRSLRLDHIFWGDFGVLAGLLDPGMSPIGNTLMALACQMPRKSTPDQVGQLLGWIHKYPHLRVLFLRGLELLPPPQSAEFRLDHLAELEFCRCEFDRVLIACPSLQSVSFDSCHAKEIVYHGIHPLLKRLPGPRRTPVRSE
ncbi:hypothetical protein PAPYR_9211 [Paratrimastix pyriformis]|uniref:F-box domain-containing protein n=1 Tax=Paratrimastix pyriformis TaxID=342808 RepID=A0ABQ8U8Z7_9EUKA|nr:hypothetical protein PAPYR_9211 [Paratrimastix pyriformis]